MNSKLILVLALAATLAAQDRPRRPRVEPMDGEINTTTRPGEVVLSAPLTVEKLGLKTPECVLHDEVADLYLISNIHGAPTEVDGNGFISRMKPDGTIENLMWIQGGKNGVVLDAPKGMAIVKDTLYVADITFVRKFDRKTGKALGSIAVKGASFLNDICAQQDGTLLVSDSGFKPDFSDSGTDALIKIGSDDKVTVQALPQRKPNGVCVLPSGAHCYVTWTTGELFADTESGSKSLGKLPKAQLDGIVALDENTFLISSWEGKCIYRVARAAGKDTLTVTELATKLEAPADLGYDKKRKRVLVPLFTEDKVVILPMR